MEFAIINSSTALVYFIKYTATVIPYDRYTLGTEVGQDVSIVGHWFVSRQVITYK